MSKGRQRGSEMKDGVLSPRLPMPAAHPPPSFHATYPATTMAALQPFTSSCSPREQKKYVAITESPRK